MGIQQPKQLLRIYGNRSITVRDTTILFVRSRLASDLILGTFFAPIRVGYHFLIHRFGYHSFAAGGQLIYYSLPIKVFRKMSHSQA